MEGKKTRIENNNYCYNLNGAVMQPRALKENGGKLRNRVIASNS